MSVANLDASAVSRRLQILADGQPFTARDLVHRPADADPGHHRRAARGNVRGRGAADRGPGRGAEGGSGAEASGPADQLAADDAAWAIVPSDRLQRILLVGPGNVYLQNALSLLPNVELYGTTGEDYAGTTGLEAFDLIVFDGFLPATLPAKPILAIAPPRTSDLGTVAGTLERPGIGRVAPDEPLLHDVDLTRSHVARAQRMELPAWARSVIPGPAQAPLLYAGTRDGLATAVLAFDLRQSDLPLQVAWPILVANLSGELLGRDASTLQPVEPGAPVELVLPPGSAGMRVTAPDGTVTELEPATSGGASVTFVGTSQLGAYTAEPIPEPPAPAASGRCAEPEPRAPARRGRSRRRPPGRSASRSTSSTSRSRTSRPATARAWLAVGGAPATAGAAGTARDEWWIPVALAALALLLVEWLVYERDGARRIRTWLGGLGRWRPLRRRGAP